MTAKDDPTNTAIGTQHPAARPILRCLPDLVRGIPICRDIFPFIAEMPSARLQENEKPYFLPIALSFLLHRTSRVTVAPLAARKVEPLVRLIYLFSVHK